MTKSTQKKHITKKNIIKQHTIKEQTMKNRWMASMAMFRRPLLPLLFLEGGVCHDALTYQELKKNT